MGGKTGESQGVRPALFLRVWMGDLYQGSCQVLDRSADQGNMNTNTTIYLGDRRTLYNMLPGSRDER
jgi:hypothetical protein